MDRCDTVYVSAYIITMLRQVNHTNTVTTRLHLIHVTPCFPSFVKPRWPVPSHCSFLTSDLEVGSVRDESRRCFWSNTDFGSAVRACSQHKHTCTHMHVRAHTDTDTHRHTHSIRNGWLHLLNIFLSPTDSDTLAIKRFEYT